MRRKMVTQFRLLTLLSIALLFFALIPVDFAGAQQGSAWIVGFHSGYPSRNRPPLVGKITVEIRVELAGTKFWKTLEPPISFEAPWGLTAEEKAKAFRDELTKFKDPTTDSEIFIAEDPIEEELGGYGLYWQVKFQLKTGATWEGKALEDIDNVSFTEMATGEASMQIRDPPRDYPMLVIFDIEGIPEDPDGVAALQIGTTYPLVKTATYGKTPEVIKSDLVSLFNELYLETEFTARINCRGAIEISDVPCKDGVIGGADDPALTWTLSMGNPDIRETSVPGVYSIFDLHNEIVKMSVRVIDSETSSMIYDIEILREDQMTPWETIEVLEVPQGWSYEYLCCGVRFYTETDPLIQCQQKTFKYRVKGTRIAWYIRTRVTDEYHNDMGLVISARWTFRYLFFLM